MNCYRVIAKCGHVKKNNYILKEFYVRALNKKEAAFKIRFTGRVKHDQKDAIRQVELISEEEFREGIKKNSNDPYLNVHNIQDQKLMCTFEEGEVIREPEPELYKKKTHAKQRLVELAIIKEWKTGGRLAYE